MNSIFSYSDYRTYLKDAYVDRKAVDPKFSHRYFAMKAGIRSSGFFSDVLSGKRNLTPALALKFAAALKLRKGEAEYFHNLVGCCQAKTVTEKTYYYEKMIACPDVTVKKLERDKFEFYSKWYYSAIRELLCFYSFDGGDFDSLGKKLVPSIPAEEARKAVELLERLGLIRRDGKTGRYQQSVPLITSGNDFKSLHVAHFQRATMTLAMEAIDRFAVTVRDSSTITMTLSEQSYGLALKEITECRKRLLAIAQKDQAVDRVYQCNMQLYPLSRFECGDQTS